MPTVKFRYVGNGEYLPGVPAADLTDEDLADLREIVSPQVLDQIGKSPIYRRVRARRPAKPKADQGTS